MADDAPVQQDLRTDDPDLRLDDQEYNPAVEPKKAKAWLNLLRESEDAFEKWHDHCDKIDKLFGSVDRLSNMARDKEFQMFWANCEVIKPSIYAKPPIPVVVPKFRDRRPIYQAASEVMERCAVVAFDLARIDDIMMLIRDDVALIGRGVAWCRYESAKDDYGGMSRRSGYAKAEKVCIDFKHRRDFLHSISRCWYEVTWVAAASYLTRSEARKRFRKTSGDEYQKAEYRVDKEAKNVGGADKRERAKFWEIWDKSSERVVWVSEGCDLILDEDDPHLDLLNFFPCPKPAYGTVQRGSLLPVPDVLQYKDQLDEINMLTSRIHALSDAIEVKGFYPSGGAELADAVQTAVATKTPGRVLVPISNWAAFGQTKDVIIWMPIDVISATVTQLVELRSKIIDDVYQLTGMADIMRGSTDPQETLGAQQLKTQYGSSRIKDKQGELVRLARDLVEITSEIITGKFDDVTLIEMSQTQLPTEAMLEAQIQGIKQQLMQAAQSPQAQQMMQQNPQAVQQVMQQAQAQIQQIQQQPTIEAVLKFLKDNRAKSFVLDIETDSTIMADENGEKQRRAEFVGMLGQLLPQLAQMVGAQPEAANFCGELLKFSVAPFRAGRSLDGAIDGLVQLMESKSGQQKGDDPTTAQGKIAVQIEQMKIAYQKSRDDADRQLKQQQIASDSQAKAAKAQSDSTIAMTEVQGRSQEHAAKLQGINAKAMADIHDDNQDMREHQIDSAIEMAKLQTKQQEMQIKSNQMAQQAADRRAQDAFKFPKGGRLIP